LKPRRHSPFDLLGIVDLDILVHDDDLFDVIVGAKGTQDDIFWLSFMRLAQFDVEVITPYSAYRQVHVQDVRETALQMSKQCGLTRNGTQQQVFHLCRHDGMEYGCLPMGN